MIARFFFLITFLIPMRIKVFTFAGVIILLVIVAPVSKRLDTKIKTDFLVRS